MFLTILSASLLTITLSSCGLFQKQEPWVAPVVVESPIPIRARPKGVNLTIPHFDVVSYKNLEEYLAKNKKRNGVVVFVAMDIRDYELTSYNQAEVNRYVEQLLALVRYYEDQIKSRKEQPESSEGVPETE